MKLLRCATLMLSVGFAGTAVSAQAGFPENFVAGVSGLEIGQTVEEARLALQDLFPNDLENVAKPTELKLQEVQRTGDRILDKTVEFQNYDGAFAIALLASSVDEFLDSRLVTSYRYKQQGASVLLGSPATGNKVQAIYRETSFDSPMNPDAISEQVAKQFGEPHLIASDRRGTLYRYAFKDGMPITSADAVSFATCGNIANALRDIDFGRDSNLLEPSQNLRGYFNIQPLKARRPVTDTCSAYMEAVALKGDDGLVSGMRFLVVDHDAMLEDILAFQEALTNNTPPPPPGGTNVSDF